MSSVLEEAVRAEIMQATALIRVKLLGLATIDPSAVGRISADILRELAEINGVPGEKLYEKRGAGPTQHDEKVESDGIDDHIAAFLGSADYPMSIEQIEGYLSSVLTEYSVKRPTLAVRLHRLAAQTTGRVIHASRGHYWASEFSRAGYRKQAGA